MVSQHILVNILVYRVSYYRTPFNYHIQCSGVNTQYHEHDGCVGNIDQIS